MKILIICGAGYVSGKEKIMFSMLKGFANQGDEVYCITSAWGNGQFEEMLVNEHISYKKIRLGFISKTFNWKAIKMTLDQLVYWPKLLYDYNKINKAFKPDVIIHSNFHHLFLLSPVIDKRKAVNVYHSHESIYNTKFYQKLFTGFQKKIQLFVGVSGFVTKKMIDLGISERYTKTIHNGLEIVGWKPNPFVPGKIFTIGIVGQVGRWKGHEDLVLALDILRKREPGLVFRLCIFGGGEPEFKNELEALIREKNLENYIEWKGFVKNIKEIYAGLQVVCVPTRTEEPFATSALEAGLYAIPVIVTRKGGFPEIVKEGHSGYIVEANDPGAIADKLAMLIKDPSLAAQAGLNHQRIVTEVFSFQNFINNWKSTLTALVS